jgi:hypothetical protein
METQATFLTLINLFLDLINSIIPLLGGVALVLFLWGALRFIYRSGNAEGHNKDKEILLWGLIALFIIFSIGGILALLKQTLIPSGN